MADDPLDMGGARVVITRPRPDAKKTARTLLRYGAAPVTASTLRLEPVPLSPTGQEAVMRAGRYDWIVFSSTNAVRHFARVIGEAGRDLDAVSGCRVAAIGSATANALVERGLVVDLVPRRYLAESLGREMGALEGMRILFPRALHARSALPDALREAGARVDLLPVYATRGVTPGPRALAGHLAS